MYIIIHKNKQRELQSYIDELKQQGWIEIKEFYSTKIERKSLIKLQHLSPKLKVEFVN